MLVLHTFQGKSVRHTILNCTKPQQQIKWTSLSMNGQRVDEKDDNMQQNMIMMTKMMEVKKNNEWKLK